MQRIVVISDLQIPFHSKRHLDSLLNYVSAVKPDLACVGDEVDVIAMAPEEECEHEMFVMIRWEKDGLGVPLSQLKVVHANEKTRQAVDDWHYWVERHYRF